MIQKQAAYHFASDEQYINHPAAERGVLHSYCIAALAWQPLALEWEAQEWLHHSLANQKHIQSMLHESAS